MKTASTVSKTDNVIQVYVHHPVLSDKAKEALPMCSMCHNMSQHVTTCLSSCWATEHLATLGHCCGCQVLAKAYDNGKFACLQVPGWQWLDIGNFRTANQLRSTPSLDFTTWQMRPAMVQDPTLQDVRKIVHGFCCSPCQVSREFMPGHDLGLWYWQYGLLIGYGFALVYAVWSPKMWRK